MKVKMKTLAAGPEGLYRPGQVVEISEIQAKALIAAGYAEPVKKGRETATVKPAEQATIPVDKVEGIEEKHLTALAVLNIRTVGDLAGAHDGAIAKTIKGIGRATARKWIQTAREMLGD